MRVDFQFGRQDDALRGWAQTRHLGADYLGCGYHGRWASHTGYRHDNTRLGSDKPLFNHVTDGAWILYHANSLLPYLVGAGDCNLWREIQTDVAQRDQYQIRLPSWAAAPICDALETLGYHEIDTLNHCWNAPLGYHLSQVKDELSPLLMPGTRLHDENSLAEAILKKYHGSSAWFARRQLDLFEDGSGVEYA